MPLVSKITEANAIDYYRDYLLHCEEAHQKHIQYWKNLPKYRHSKFFLKEPLTRTASRRFLHYIFEIFEN